MKEIINQEQFINKYIEYREHEEELLKKNDWKKTNIFVKKFLKFKKRNFNKEYLSDALFILMNNEKPNVRVSAAIDSIKQHFHVDYAIQLLKKESKCKENGICALTAESVLQNIEKLL